VGGEAVLKGLTDRLAQWGEDVGGRRLGPQMSGGAVSPDAGLSSITGFTSRPR
jgi:hypothetical protein